MKNNYLTLDDYRENEEKEFSVIEVYPYLNYEETEEFNEKDLSNLFQVSLNSDICCLNIHVRSQQAQREITSYLIGKGFDNVQCTSGNSIGLLECVQLIDHDEDEILEQPRYRRYFNSDCKKEEFLLTKSSLLVHVQFRPERLSEFKQVIKSLREKKSFRNRWRIGDNYIIK